ncbi:MAG: PstS family phosphate ABC transporter substrate-binding protein, partial [Planctomycetaceae bacterium]
MVAFFASFFCLVSGCDKAPSPSSSGDQAGAASGGRDQGAGASLQSELLAPTKLKQLKGTITIDGSSSVFPVTEAVAEEFQNATGGAVRVPVAHAGTGGGFKKFARGEIDICDACRPISESEITACRDAGIEYTEIPVCFDALTVAVHPSNTLNSITVEQLNKIWSPESQGKVMKWSDVDSSWPAVNLKLFGAGSDSGTFDYFTEAIVGKAKSSRGDYSASEDDNTLVTGIAGDKGALGYVPFAYFTENRSRLKALAIDWEKDDLGPVEPTLANVLEAKYNPLARPLFIYVNQKSAERPEVRSFVEFYLANAVELVEEVKYMPLPPAAYQAGLARFRAGTAGTLFGGQAQIGVKIEDVLQ